MTETDWVPTPEDVAFSNFFHSYLNEFQPNDWAELRKQYGVKIVNNEIRFDTEEDRLLFLIRWS